MPPKRFSSRRWRDRHRQRGLCSSTPRRSGSWRPEQGAASLLRRELSEKLGAEYMSPSHALLPQHLEAVEAAV
ncbi:hypothetical protein EJB05_21326 [Eragrostis curvula]|uniref:Uncharacterized protein n=1 Tax=Eragrostis curvula TaxID=38414 RepID=A0A5J9V0M8_9POAL|nr:hypothetical protein EJB05_21326 [Eragrostis curvula]